MTEQEWLASTDPVEMVWFLTEDTFKGKDHWRGLERPSERKLRLFACACVRQVWPLLTDAAACERCNGRGELPDPSNSGWLRGGGPCPSCYGTGRINGTGRIPRHGPSVRGDWVINLLTGRE